MTNGTWTTCRTCEVSVDGPEWIRVGFRAVHKGHEIEEGTT